GALDRDVGVLLLEAADQRLDRVVLGAAHLLVPDGQGEVAEGGDVGVDLAGRRCRSIGAAAVGDGSAGRQETQPAQRAAGAEESSSTHDVLLTDPRPASSSAPGPGRTPCGELLNAYIICAVLH